jgi:hypothetical protein
MRSGPTRIRVRLAAACAVLLALGFAGCGPGLEVNYGKSRGASLNGTSVFAQMLRDRGQDVRTAIRLTDGLADWATGIVRFAPHPGPPSLEEAAWYRNWLTADSDRRLIYVVRDFDTVAEYWEGVRDGLSEASEPGRRAEAEQKRFAAARWFDKLPAKAKPVADSREWFENDKSLDPPRACTKLSGPWATGIDAAAAGLTVHEPLKPARGFVLLEGDGKPLVVEKVVGRGKVLVIASGVFLLNEAVVNPARRPLAERVIEWITDDTSETALVEGPNVLGADAGAMSIWSLMRRIPSLRWVMLQAGLAALLAALARAPRLGRPRPDPPSGADRPAEHAVALGTLLARARAAPEAHELLERYQRWRFPRTSRPGESRPLGGASNTPTQHDGATASPNLT